MKIGDVARRTARKTHEERTETHTCDCISRQAAIDALENTKWGEI